MKKIILLSSIIILCFLARTKAQDTIANAGAQIKIAGVGIANHFFSKNGLAVSASAPFIHFKSGSIDYAISYADVVTPASLSINDLLNKINAMLNNATGEPTTSVAVSNFPNPQTISGNIGIEDPINPGNTLSVNGSGQIGISNFPTTQPVSGVVSVGNFPSSQAVTGALNIADAISPANTLSVNGSGQIGISNFPTTQPVSGVVSVGNFPGTQAVSGNINAAQSGAWNITNISGTISLPTGAATSANQTSGNTSLSTLATNLPAKGQTTMTGSLPVVIASNQSNVPVTIANTPAVTVSGNVNNISQGYSYLHLSGTGSGTVNAGSGLMHTITINTHAGSAASLQLSSSGSAFCNIDLTQVVATYTFDVNYSNLTYTMSGTADITITYR